MIKKTLATAAIILATMSAAHAVEPVTASDKIQLCKVEAYSVEVVMNAMSTGLPKKALVSIAEEADDDLARKLLLRELKNAYNGEYAGMTTAQAKKSVFSKCIEVQFQ